MAWSRSRRALVKATGLGAALVLAAAGTVAWADSVVTPPGSAVTASADDGNVPANTVDNDLSTRWSANGDAQWICYDLGARKRVTAVLIAFYRGDARRALFDIQVSLDDATWATVLGGQQGSGMTLQEETFDIPDTETRYVRYLGHGNSANTWNSLTEVDILAADIRYTRAAVASATASTSDGNLPHNVLDGNLGTRWSASGDGQWLTLDLGAPLTVGLVELAFSDSGTRQYTFDLQVSTDNTTWTTVWSGHSGGAGSGLESVDFTDVPARYVRYLGHGNSIDPGNSLTEAEVDVVSGQSQHLSLGTDGRLGYPPYANGDTIPDFSRAGYGGGGVALPVVPARKTVSPVTGDAGAVIQSAIDEVSALPLDANGFRGAVLLTAGTYEIAGSVTIRASGVVLRGEGDGPGGTVIKATGTSTRTVINVAGRANRAEVSGTRQRITDAYVPVGAHSFTVADASGFRVGDDVIVVRTPNQEWIDAVGMDSCTTVGTGYDTADVDGSTCLDNPWTPASRTIHYERRITAVDGNRITIDSPVVEAFQAEFGGGAVYQYQFPGRIRQAGVEYLRAESSFASDIDEAHAERMIGLSNVEDAWVRNVTSVYFVQGTVLVGSGAKYVTVQDSASLDHKSQITGGRRYPFDIDDGSHVLVMRCYTRTGRHDYVTGSTTPGPNVFLDGRAEQSYSELGPHHRWATGTLFDNIVHRSVDGAQIMGAYNRGNLGSGHGWSGAYQVFYNCLGDTHRVSSPPYARNWSVGCRATRRQGTGEYDSYAAPVAPWSLYLEQLRDRLGDAALATIGY